MILSKIKCILIASATIMIATVFQGCSRVDIPRNEVIVYEHGAVKYKYNELENKIILEELSKMNWHSNWVTYVPGFPSIESNNIHLIISGNKLIGGIMNKTAVYCVMSPELNDAIKFPRALKNENSQ